MLSQSDKVLIADALVESAKYEGEIAKFVMQACEDACWWGDKEHASYLLKCGKEYVRYQEALLLEAEALINEVKQ